jgi:hypothetical protein
MTVVGAHAPSVPQVIVVGSVPRKDTLLETDGGQAIFRYVGLLVWSPKIIAVPAIAPAVVEC